MPLQQCYAAVQSLLLHPRLTLLTATMFRPVLLPVVADLVEARQRSGTRASNTSSEPACAVALVALLDFAPHIQG